jgi:hypothetical protein
MSDLKSNVPKIANNFNTSMDNAKKQFLNMLNNRSTWGTVFLTLVIIFLIWIISWYINNKLRLKNQNNRNMSYNLDYYDRTIGSIKQKDLSMTLRDYYIMSSYNSCCGGNTLKDFVDKTPLKKVIDKGTRFLDFEIYSIDGKPIIAAGKESNTNGKYCIKGTYNHLDFDEVIDEINRNAFNGNGCPNPSDPLFLNFRIKTNKTAIYKQMYNKLNKEFREKLLPLEYLDDGHLSKQNNITNIPLAKLRNKVIICVDDKNKNYVGSDLEKIISISNKGADGRGMPFVAYYKDREIIQTYDTDSLKERNTSQIAISMPDFRNKVYNSSSAIHHAMGVQIVSMNFNVLDTNMKTYLNFFNSNGSAFVLKPKHLRFKKNEISRPKNQKPSKSLAPKKFSALAGAIKGSL